MMDVPENSPPLKKEGAGRPEFVPTAADRTRVLQEAGNGLRHEMIASFVINPTTGRPIDDKTLRKHFEDELSIGKARACSVVGRGIFDTARGTGPQAIVAAIFIAKTQMGWTEKSQLDVNVGGVLVPPAGTTPQEWLVAVAAQNAKSKEPGA